MLNNRAFCLVAESCSANTDTECQCNLVCDMQVALQRLTIVEKQRQSAVEELQAAQAGLHISPSSRLNSAGPGKQSLQADLEKARADWEAATFRADEAEARLLTLASELRTAQACPSPSLLPNHLWNLHPCACTSSGLWLMTFLTWT